MSRGLSLPITRAVLTLACLSAGLACGPHAQNCPNQSSPTCPAVVPDFATEVQPIFQAVCVTCHSPGGQEASVPLTSYAEITNPRFKTTAFSNVLGCVMPPANAPMALSESDRQVLLAWFACGTPDAGTPDATLPDGGAADGSNSDGGAPDL
jgi:uncharacterized membrane protein